MQNILANLFSFGDNYQTGTKVHLTIFELFVAIYAVKYAWQWGLYILRIDEVVLPLGLAHYIDISLFFENHMSLVIAGLLTLFVIVAFFVQRYKWLYLLAFILLHLQYVTRFSLGEIPHSSNFIGFSLLGLGLGGIFFKSIKDKLFFAFGFTVFFVGLGYTSAGISKLIGTGITWVDGYHLWLWIGEKSVDVLSATGNFEYSWIQKLALESRLISTLILIVGIGTELIGFLMWWRKLRPFITVLLIGMHIGIYLSMNIFFLSFMIELIIIGFPWYYIFEKADKTYPSLSKWINYRFTTSSLNSQPQPR